MSTSKSRRNRSAKPKASPVQEKVDTFWDVKGGIHPAELRIIQRGLRLAMAAGQAHKAQLKAQNAGPYDMTTAQEEIDAIVRVSDRLRKDIAIHIDPKTRRQLIVEFAFKCMEKGMNLQAAWAEAEKHYS